VSRVRRWRTCAGIAGALLLAGCGLPGGGSAESVDDESVPYRLLDPGTPSRAVPDADPPPDAVPLVFWLDDTELLVPAEARSSCAQSPEEQVGRILRALSAGPSDEARAGGRGTAIPPQSRLELVRVDDGTAEVEVRPGSEVSADLLPLAVGQVVLSVTSAGGVDAVALLDDGQPVQVPVPGGALATAPVTAADYAGLLTGRYRRSTAGPGHRLGCPEG
jgi:spore germination protein GerM